MKMLKHTRDLVKMDLRRTFRTQPFYWLMLCAATMVMVVFMTGIDESTTLSGLIGPYSAGAFNPMTSMMGISIVPLFAMIAFVLNIGGDFSTGFAKNIFTFHSNKWEYILSKVVGYGDLHSVYSVLYGGVPDCGNDNGDSVGNCQCRRNHSVRLSENTAYDSPIGYGAFFHDAASE